MRSQYLEHRKLSAGSRRNRRRPRRVIVFLIVLVAVTISALDTTFDDGPVDVASDGVRDAFAAVADVSPGGTSSSDGEVENLRRQVDEMRGMVARTEDIDRQRRELLQLLNLPAPLDTRKVAARVSDLHASNYDASIEIDKGSDDGIANGMPVTTGAGLVGRVTDVSNRRATVVLIGDSTSNVGVRFGGTGELGVAAGGGAEKSMQVDLIDPGSQIKPGDVAVTSGLAASPFPPGLPVGRVTEVTPGVQSLRPNIRMQQIVDVSNLDVVAVLVYDNGR